MTLISQSTHLRWAYAKLERHKPVRAAWANRLTGSESANILCACVAIMPILVAFLLAAAGASHHHAYPLLTKALVWLAVLITGAGAAGFVVIKAMFKRSVVGVCSSELAVTMTYVAKCPRMKATVRRWMEQGTDGMLSYQEIEKIKDVARAANIYPSETYSGPKVELDERFYRLFPGAPRLDCQIEAERFAGNVACVDAVVGHIATAEARARAHRLDEVLSPACSSLNQPRQAARL